MSELGNYLQQEYKNDFFIEVEGKRSVIEKFLSEYNDYRNICEIPSEGIVNLTEEQNKYGIEYRVYLKHTNNIPSDIEPITHNKHYRKEYPFRISQKQYVKPLLFEDGFNLGINRT